MSKLNLDITEEFIDLDDVWQSFGYSRKDSAKRKFFSCGFEEGEDYFIRKKNPDDKKNGRPVEAIVMTQECYKKFCMKSATSTACKARTEYIEKKEVKESVSMLPQLQAIQDQIDKLTIKSQQAEDRANKAEEKYEELKKRCGLSHNKGWNYAFRVYKNKNIFKIGQCGDLDKRKKGYDCGRKPIEYDYICPTVNKEFTERIIKERLKEYKYYPRH